MESEADSGTYSSHPEVNKVVEAEGRDGYPRAIEYPIFELVVYHAEEERHDALYSGPAVEFAEAFAGRMIYSVSDLYSGHDQFQLAVESRDITMMRTPLGLVPMCTLPQGGTNSVAHMVDAMNKVLRDCIPEITMPVMDDIPIKGYPVEDKDEG